MWCYPPSSIKLHCCIELKPAKRRREPTAVQIAKKKAAAKAKQAREKKAMADAYWVKEAMNLCSEFRQRVTDALANGLPTGDILLTLRQHALAAKTGNEKKIFSDELNQLRQLIKSHKK